VNSSEEHFPGLRPGRIAWVGERELATLSPTRAIRLIEAKLARPESHIAALLAS
jgi:hypothetical protein